MAPRLHRLLVIKVIILAVIGGIIMTHQQPLLFSMISSRSTRVVGGPTVLSTRVVGGPTVPLEEPEALRALATFGKVTPTVPLPTSSSTHHDTVEQITTRLRVPIEEPEALRALATFGKVTRAGRYAAPFKSPVYSTPRWIFVNAERRCNFVLDPAGYHHICALDSPILPKHDCRAITYGVSFHHQMESQLAEDHGCSVMMFDPTVDLPEVVGDRLRFYKKGAPSAAFPVGSPSVTPLTSAAGLFGKGMSISVVKMDCEGCEYSLYDDLMSRGESVLDRIDQLALEIHLSERFATSREDVVNLGKLFALLIRHRFRPVVYDVGHCTGNDRNVKIHPLFRESGYVSNELEEHNFGHCQNVLFGKVHDDKAPIPFSHCGSVTTITVTRALRLACAPDCGVLDKSGIKKFVANNAPEAPEPKCAPIDDAKE